MVVQRGLDRTAQLWPEVREAYAWVHQAAHILANHAQHDETAVRTRYEQLLTTLRQQQPREGWIGRVISHFLNVTANYGDGLFQCYDVPDCRRQTMILNDVLARCATMSGGRVDDARSVGRWCCVEPCGWLQS